MLVCMHIVHMHVSEPGYHSNTNFNTSLRVHSHLLSEAVSYFTERLFHVNATKIPETYCPYLFNF